MPEIEKAVANYQLDEYYGKALDLITSGKARKVVVSTKVRPPSAAALRRLLVPPCAARPRYAGDGVYSVST